MGRRLAAAPFLPGPECTSEMHGRGVEMGFKFKGSLIAQVQGCTLGGTVGGTCLSFHTPGVAQCS